MKKMLTIAALTLFAVSSVALAADGGGWLDKFKNKPQKKNEDKKNVPSKDVSATPSSTAVNDAHKAVPEGAKKHRKDMSKEELSAETIKVLDREESIINMIPGLKKETGPDGKVYYTHQGVRLEDLDREAIDKIYIRVHQEDLRIRTDRLTRQMENARRATATAVSAPRIQAVVTTPPRVPSTPQIPKAAQSPSRPPTPPTPPSPPRR
jgi:hypothetical protein